MTDIYKSATSNSVFIELVDSTTGLPKTGIVHTDVTGSYVRTRSARVAITMATLASASASFSSGGFILIDDTNQPGVYRIDVPDAAFATSAVAVVVTVKATGCRTVSRLFNLVDINNQVACLPNVAAGGVGGLLIAPTTANTGLSNVTQFGGTAGTFASGVPTAALDSAATAALVDLIWDEPLTGATHNVATSSGKRLRQTTAFQQIDSTVIDAAATTTTFITGLTSSVDNFYNDSMLVFTDGALAGQVRAIYDYIGATKTIVLAEALTSAPVNGVAFTIVSLHIHPVSQIQSGLATAAALATESGKITNIENASGYLLAVLAGACADPQTASETYAITVFGSTFTVDMAGQTSTGTRTAPTLTKS